MDHYTGGRRRRWALAALLAAALLAAVACGPSGPARVTLAELADRQEEFDGREVIAEGVVRTFDDPKHWWIEDAEVNRVELVGRDGLDELVGSRVRVQGTFTFRDDEGRRIVVEQLEVLSPGAPAG